MADNVASTPRYPDNPWWHQGFDFPTAVSMRRAWVEEREGGHPTRNSGYPLRHQRCSLATSIPTAATAILIADGDVAIHVCDNPFANVDLVSFDDSHSVHRPQLPISAANPVFKAVELLLTVIGRHSRCT